MKSIRSVFGLIVCIGFFFFQSSFAQSEFKILEALRIESDSEISLDGNLSEQIWQRAQIASDFTQMRPFDGNPASERTEVRVLYSNKYLYVGAKAFDSAPDSITAPLFRRDGLETSDWVYINLDSYNDNRTAFTFAVNPYGVQKDIMYFDDTSEDILWDAVWQAESNIVEDGWVVEMRIPLSQLRFNSQNDVQQWGLNFQRRIARRGEISYWNRTELGQSGLVSKFGELQGISDLGRPMRLEILPYASSGFTRDDTGNEGNPFYEQNEFEAKVGGDIKYGITSDFTLTATINPDFGQVEADPATINLTEFETFFEERRPFFLEGSDIFNFGGTTSQNTFRSHSNFYSRRIGRTPFGIDAWENNELQGIGISSSDVLESNQITTIAGAAKISGKTQNGLSIGFLDSYTLEESTNFFLVSDSTQSSFVIEPATNYFVGRVRQDLKSVDAQIGIFGSSVNRSMSGSYLEDYIHSSAYQVGADAQYYWNNRDWGASGVFALSNVNGTEEAITRTQNTSARFFGRVDSDYLSLDTTKTSLIGYFTELSVGKYAGEGLRYSFTYSEMSPEYEINDIGFLERADYRAPHIYFEYLNFNTSLVQYYFLWSDVSYAWNFDGNKIYDFKSFGAYFLLNNLWSVTSLTGFSGKFYNDRISRGGYIMRRPKDWYSYLSVTSNTSKDVYGTVTAQYRRDAAGEYQINGDISLNVRPTTNIQLSIAPGYLKSKDLDQYITFFDVTDDFQSDYVFSSIDLDVIYTEIRANITFSPTISLQTYLRPYYYKADFYGFKAFSERKSFNFENATQFWDEYLDVEIDQEFKTVQGNAVLRWEYRPGSTLFFVWQQERSGFFYTQDSFSPISGSIDTFRQDPINIFLIKLSYWFGS